MEALDFGVQNVDFFRQVLSRCKEERSKLSEIEGVKEIGIVSLSCGAYKQVVERTSDILNAKIYSSIPGILQARSEQLLQDIKANYELIVFNPLSLKEYIAFLKDTVKVGIYFENTQTTITDNSDLLVLSESFSIKIHENIRNLIGEANGQMIGLSRRLSEIEKNANDLADKFKKEI